MKDLVEIQCLYGKSSRVAIEESIKDLAQLRIEVFKDFPYLYDGDLNYELKYLRTYLESSSSIIILAQVNGRLVGASTGLAMKEETDEFKQPFIERGVDIGTLFYCGESILKKEYRGLGFYRKFFEGRESHARELIGIEQCVFCSVYRPINHPLRPNDYMPLNSIWEKFGYREYPNIRTTYRWKDVNQQFETEKEMIFWMKRLK